MLVLLKTGWFGPGGVYYTPNKMGTVIPDKLCERDANGKWKHLPSAAKLLKVAPKDEPVVLPALKDLDEARAASDALIAAGNAQAPVVPLTKEQKRLAKAAALRAQIEAENE